MKNIYHKDIYKFEKPVKSYWEDTTKENFNLKSLTEDIKSDVVVIGGGYTGLSCAINLIENYNLDVILLEAGKVGWGASSRNGGFCAFPPIKTSFKNGNYKSLISIWWYIVIQYIKISETITWRNILILAEMPLLELFLTLL